MDKNWLIRTKSNHILGPISKEKVLELYQNNSIKPDDEVCSGNGFWFFIREEDMVAKYILNNEVQGFNPISEAKDVLTLHTHEGHGDKESDDITLVAGINLSQLKDTEATPSPSALKSKPIEEKKEVASKGLQKKNNSINKPKIIKVGKPLKKQNYLLYLGILGFLFLFCLVYFRNSIIRSLFHGEVTSTEISFLSNAHAQEDVPDKKKSS